jgi:hypothetical protein
MNAVSSIVSIHDDGLDFIVNFFFLKFKIDLNCGLVVVELVRSIVLSELEEGLLFLFGFWVLPLKLLEGRKSESVFVTSELLFSLLCLPHSLEDALPKLWLRLLSGGIFLEIFRSSEFVGVVG